MTLTQAEIWTAHGYMSLPKLRDIKWNQTNISSDCSYDWRPVK